MLTYDDAPTIRNAILKRLDTERGVAICDIKMQLSSSEKCIRVGVLATLDDALVLQSRFDLPETFEIGHLHNEIDEIAEQYKSARVDFWRHGRVLPEKEREMLGTGLRGRWASYGG